MKINYLSLTMKWFIQLNVLFFHIILGFPGKGHFIFLIIIFNWFPEKLRLKTESSKYPMEIFGVLFSFKNKLRPSLLLSLLALSIDSQNPMPIFKQIRAHSNTWITVPSVEEMALWIHTCKSYFDFKPYQFYLNVYKQYWYLTWL